MKDFKIPEYDLGEHPLETAFEIVFSHDTIKETHGDTLVTTPWEDGLRIAEYVVGIDAIPWCLKHIFGSQSVKVTVHQTLKKDEKNWKVDNNIKMHFLGARFFKIKSHFSLEERDDKHIYLSGEVICNAILLPPLNRFAESYMISQCKKEVDKYTQSVTQKFSTM